MDRTLDKSDEELLTIALGDRWRTMTEMEIVRALDEITHPRRTDEKTQR